MQVESGHELLVNGAEAGVNVVNVNRGCIRRLIARLPEMAHCAGEEPEHPTHSLEIRQRRCLAGESVENLRVKWIGPAKRFDDLWLHGFVRDRIALGRPQGAIRVDYLGGEILVDGLKEAATQDQDGLVILRGIEERGFSGRNTLRLSHLLCQELVLLGVGILRLAVPTDR